MLQNNTIELPPSPGYLIQSLRCIGYTLDTAIADIIDNSITAGSTCISVQYRWNEGKPWIAIIDDGCGMSQGQLNEAMRFGGSSSPSDVRSTDDLGRFGLGLKTASLSQCRLLTVISKQGEAINACAWDVDLLTKEKTTKWNAVIPNIQEKHDMLVDQLVERLSKQINGTAVIWQNLDSISSINGKKTSDYFTETICRTSKHIGLVFHRFFVSERGEKKIKIDFNDTEVEPFNPFGPNIASRRELIVEKIPIQGCKIEIQPYVLPYKDKLPKSEYDKYGGDDGYLHNQGFYVYRNKRLIVHKTWFHLAPKTELTKLLRVRVDIPNSLDNLWRLDVKKSQAFPPQVVLERLKEVIKRIAHEGRNVYLRRASHTVDKTVHIWRREIKNGKICYIINEKHPFVEHLICDLKGKADPQKCSFMRIISDAFPIETFHVDVNNDDKNEISHITSNEEAKDAVLNLIISLRKCGIDEKIIKDKMINSELPVSQEMVQELIMKVFYV